MKDEVKAEQHFLHPSLPSAFIFLRVGGFTFPQVEK
jgi:hypothetical protein